VKYKTTSINRNDEKLVGNLIIEKNSRNFRQHFEMLIGSFALVPNSNYFLNPESEFFLVRI
jgi:hypothetical protein